MDILSQFDQGYEGFQTTNEQTLSMLTKALTAGSGVDAGAFTGGRALIPESLDTTLVNILHSQEDAVLFRKLKKQPIKSPVHQWDERTDVGASDGAWVAEGGDSEEGDQTIARKYTTAKYLQCLRKVTLQMSVSNTIEDAIGLEKNAGTLWIIKQIENALFNGDSSYVAEQPDGLKALIPSTHVLDMRGANANSETFANNLEYAAEIVRNYFGKLTDVFSSTAVMTDIQRLIRDRIRFESGVNPTGSAVFTKYTTPFGDLVLNPDIFIVEGRTPSASSLTTKRPGAVTINSATPSSDSSSKFGSSDAGNYYYQVVAVNKYGDAVATASSVVAVASGEIVTINVTEGSPVATAFKVYRSKKNASDATDCREAFTVARTAATQDIVDTNDELPGCSSAYLLTMDPMYDAIEFDQFLPMMKFDLYPTASAVYPFLMLLFGALALKKSVQHIRIKNISSSRLSWF